MRTGVASRWLRPTAAVVVGCVALVVAVAPRPAGASAAVTPDRGAAAVIARYQARIPELMAEQDVPGLSVAVVDGDRVLWAQGFGSADRDGRTPVTADTMFSVQSMSKLFTATAVMRAVGDGRLDLDVPITTYLPEFTVHSAFEADPERRITLRMLLSHTAGFTHEAPVGNNYEVDPSDFDEHIRSISETWLRFPVGTGYAYSNLGMDLAGYILERVAGRPFAAVMDEELLEPLGMDDSTFDRARIRATADRASGRYTLLAKPPVDVAMTAAGGLYSSATDLARFLRFQLGHGTIDGRTVLDPALMDEMRTVPAPHAGAPAGYALGVARTRWRAGGYQDLFSHGGGGYGFLSDLWFLPRLQLGIALLTNSGQHDLQGDLALSILRDLVTEPGSVYGERLAALPTQADVFEGDGQFQPPARMGHLVAALALPASDEQAARWAGYAGAWRIATWGIILPNEPPSRFYVRAGVPFFDSVDIGGTVARHRLTEFEPGLFVADDGDTLDLRGPQPTWRNLDLVPANGGPLPWQWAMLGLVAMAAVGWLASGLVAVVRRRRRRDAGGSPPPGRRWRRLMSGVATLAAILALATIALVAALPAVVDAGFIGWLELPLAMRVALHVPLAVAIVAGFMVALAAVGLARRWWSPGSQPVYVALAVALVVLAGQLAAWRLVGWGFG